MTGTLGTRAPQKKRLLKHIVPSHQSPPTSSSSHVPLAAQILRSIYLLQFSPSFPFSLIFPPHM